MADRPTPVIYDAHTPDLFADGTTGFFNFNGNVRITLESFRPNHVTNPAVVERVVVGQLVMPLEAARKLARALLEFIGDDAASAPPPASAPVTMQ